MDELYKTLEVHLVRVETRQRECRAQLQSCAKELEKVKKLQRKYKGAHNTLLELESNWNSKTRVVSSAGQ